MTAGKGKAGEKKVSAKKTPARKKAIGKEKAVKAVEAPGQPSPAEVVGTVAWLMMQSKNHRELKLRDLEWAVLPPVMAGQFRIFRKDNQPIGFASWARVSPRVNERLETGEFTLEPDDWTSGDSFWLVDLLAPFGGQEEVLRTLEKGVFRGGVSISQHGELLKLMCDK